MVGQWCLLFCVPTANAFPTLHLFLGDGLSTGSGVLVDHVMGGLLELGEGHVRGCMELVLHGLQLLLMAAVHVYHVLPSLVQQLLVL